MLHVEGLEYPYPSLIAPERDMRILGRYSKRRHEDLTDEFFVRLWRLVIVEGASVIPFVSHAFVVREADIEGRIVVYGCGFVVAEEFHDRIHVGRARAEQFVPAHDDEVASLGLGRLDLLELLVHVELVVLGVFFLVPEFHQLFLVESRESKQFEVKGFQLLEVPFSVIDIALDSDPSPLLVGELTARYHHVHRLNPEFHESRLSLIARQYRIVGIDHDHAVEAVLSDLIF